MNNTCRVFLLRIIIIIQITPKYFSKNTFNFSITFFFFSCLLPPPKRDIAGRILFYEHFSLSFKMLFVYLRTKQTNPYGK